VIQICKRCRRANPTEAVYCHHDGHILEGHAGGKIPASGAAIDIGALPFAVPFILPSGHTCRNFNELALACHSEPKTALELLRAGHLEAFLAGQGRGDLAGAARAAARAADRVRGLDEFLGRLPASALRPARLRVEPMLIDLGTLHPGEDRRCELVLHNEGMRLLVGSASCEASSWLSLGEGSGQQSTLFQFSGRSVLPVRILGRRLRAYRKPQEARVLLESNGGTVTVVVRVEVPVKPFPSGVLAGAMSPRQLAEKARETPKEAIPLIENGAVARWYESNGWPYPVTGPTASGLAAVQQLFEALGLAKAPQVELGEDAILLRGPPGQTIEHVIAAFTQENRAVVAHGTSDQPWLRIGSTVFRGRTATLPLTIPAVPGRPGDTLLAKVSITANGDQRFEVPVTLVVEGQPLPSPSAAPLPKPSVAPLPSVPVPLPVPLPVSAGSPSTSNERPLWLTLLPAGLLVLLLLGAGLRDYLAPAHHQKQDVEVVLDPVPQLENRFHDVKHTDELEKLWLTDPQPTMRFGVVMLHKGQAIGQGVNVRRLTFDPWGRTNNTCLRFDKTDERLFGGPGGSWVEREARNWKDDQGQKHKGVKSV